MRATTGVGFENSLGVGVVGLSGDDFSTKSEEAAGTKRLAAGGGETGEVGEEGISFRNKSGH